jgi:hypothetical protein
VVIIVRDVAANTQKLPPPTRNFRHRADNSASRWANERSDLGREPKSPAPGVFEAPASASVGDGGYLHPSTDMGDRVDAGVGVDVILESQIVSW